MAEQGALHIIQALTRKWSRNNLVAALLFSAAVALPLASLAHFLLRAPVWVTALVFLLSALLVFWLRKPRRLSTADLSSYLNRTYPQLEESTHLLLQPASSLNILQRLQAARIAPLLRHLPPPASLQQGLYKSAGVLGIAVVLSLGIGLLAPYLPATARYTGSRADTANLPVKETLLPGIQQVRVQVTPPAYTERAPRQQQQFTLKVEAGSRLQWHIQTNQPLPRLQLVFNARDTLPLTSTDSIHWQLQKNIQETGFYQAVLDGQASQLYTLEVVPDLPVNIHILSPQQYTAIEPGREPRSTVSVQLTDDYGIQQASLIATNASGKGESVRFQEQSLSFGVNFTGQREMLLSKVLDLPALGLRAGDELYFYIRARDNHGQESRSDMYFISLPDTAELLSMSGMESGISQVPEYFRSQRQIIIDIEKLLQRQAAMPLDSFHLHSNTLGDDQKLLRLRYGKFLGEEWESGGHHPGDGHDHSHEGKPPGNTKAADKEHEAHEGHEHGEHEQKETPTVPIGDIKALEEQYAHKHDNAEDATYFEPEQKAQLKAILTEMWSSELKLRTYYPRAALPYAYKALRLLKDMQQKSRAYVSKTSIRMPPLKPEKRLTGELDKIGNPVNHSPALPEDRQATTLATAMQVLEPMKKGSVPTADEVALLMDVIPLLAQQAVKAPADYLPALNSLRSITQGSGTPGKAAIARLQAVLLKLLAPANALPQQHRISGRGQLTDSYFKHLQKSRP